MLEDIDFICEVLRILMEACTDNGNDLNKTINSYMKWIVVSYPFTNQ